MKRHMVWVGLGWSMVAACPGGDGPELADAGPYWDGGTTIDAGPALDGGHALDGGFPFDGGGPPPGCEARWPGVRFGTAGDDAVHALAVDGEGRVIVGGFERGERGEGQLAPSGDAAAFVSWLGLDGNTLGSAQIDTPSADVIEDLVAGEDGWVRAVGRTLGALPGATSGGQYDAFFAKFRFGEGGPVHHIQLGGPQPEHPRRLAVVGDSWFAVGYTDIYVPSNYVEEWEDPLFATVSFGPAGFSEGSLSRWSTPETDFSQDILPVGDGTGDLLITYHGTVGGRRGAWLVRRSPAGEERWRARLTATGYDSAVAVLPGPDRHVRVIGSTFAPVGPVAYGEMDVFVADVRLADGLVAGIVQSGGPGADWVHDAVAGPDGSVYVAGETDRDFISGEPTDISAFVLQVGGDGEPIAVWQGDAPGYDAALTVAVDGCGRVLVGGWTEGSLNPGVPSAGHRDGFVVEAVLTPP